MRVKELKKKEQELRGQGVFIRYAYNERERYVDGDGKLLPFLQLPTNVPVPMPVRVVKVQEVFCALLGDDGDSVRIGAAVQSPLDTFNKKVGRAIALSRALNGPQLSTGSDLQGLQLSLKKAPVDVPDFLLGLIKKDVEYAKKRTA